MKRNKALTHKELVERAGRWLRNTKRLNPVFTEKGSQAGLEFPDAIGWNSHHSILVECKSSIDDFRSDHRKIFRKYPELGMGNLRYFMCVEGTIQPFQVPNGFGLLYCKGRIVKVVKQSEGFQANLHAERIFLRSRILNGQMDLIEREGSNE